MSNTNVLPYMRHPLLDDNVAFELVGDNKALPGEAMLPNVFADNTVT